MTPEQRFIDIIKTMIEFGMLDVHRLNDTEYVIERVELYLEAKNFVDKNFAGMF